MAYTAYETASGEAMSDVAALCRHAARGASATFTSTTVPALASVERWLTMSHAYLVGMLRHSGISDVQADASVIAILQQLNVYDVCRKIELSFPSDASSGQPNARFQWFDKQCDELMECIEDGTLAALGAATVDTGMRVPILTGQSLSRKQLANDDTDRTQHHVKRDQFTSVGLINPGSGSENV